MRGGEIVCLGLYLRVELRSRRAEHAAKRLALGEGRRGEVCRVVGALAARVVGRGEAVQLRRGLCLLLLLLLLLLLVRLLVLLV